MADHPNPRLYRGPDAAYRDDAYGNAGSGTPVPSANDPLAELARLIGNDSFNANRQAPAAAPAHQPHDAYPADGYDYPQPDPNAGYSDQYAPQNFSEPSLQHDPAGYPAYAADPNAQYDAQYHAAPQAHDPHYASQEYGAQNPAAYDEQPAAPYADPYRRDASPTLAAPPEFLGQRGFPPAGYGQDAQPTEDYYEEASPKRHRAILMASAAAALVVIGTAGAFGYRALFGSSSSGPPPVIKADATPTKIVSAAPRDVSANKSIQDRIGDQLNERVVSREEQPSDVRPQPRVVFPGPTANNNAQQPAGANALAAGEPKKVRTVAIRPDQAGDPDPASARQASVAPPARAANVPQAPVRQVAPVASAPAPVATPSNGPLSLSPDAGSASQAPAARMAARPAPQAAAPVQSASAGPGAYVQVSSQRSEGDAQASFRALQAKYPSVLGSRNASIQRADLGDKGTYYRAMIGPLGGPDAVELCTSLKAAGGTCVIQKN